MKIWLLQLPRLNDWYSWGLKEIENLLKKLGQPVEVIDINHEVYKKFYDTDDWLEIEKNGILGRSKMPMDQVKELIEKCISPIRSGDVVLSCVFTTESRSWFQITNSILRLKYGKDIILGSGGNGTRDPGESELQSDWADDTLATGLSDIVFLGQAIETVKQWVQGNFKARGKLYFQNKKFPDLGYIPAPLLKHHDSTIANDGSYIAQNLHGDLKHRPDQKERHDTKVVIHFTQGCVKKCKFCDVWRITPQFTMKKPIDVIHEIDFYHKNMKIEKIHFADNMINASDSAFIKFLELFYEWKIKNNQEQLTWGSQISVKPVKQQKKEMFELINATKGQLITGFDHASDKVLQHMNKLYQWQDVEHFISKTTDHNITIGTALWLVGYPTETQQDFDQYKKLLDLNSVANSIHSHMVLPVGINKGSSLEKLVTLTPNPNDWYNDIVNKDIRTQRKKYLDEALLTSGSNLNYKNIVEIRASR